MEREGTPVWVTSAEDPRIGDYRDLTDAARRRSIESRNGIFVLEGAGSVRRAIDCGWPLLSILLLPGKADALPELVAASYHQNATVYIAERPVYDRIAGFPVHRGVLAIAARRPMPDPVDVVASMPDRAVVVVVEGVNDHENMGALFRNAAALGAGAVLVDPTCCDPLYRRSVRVSMGQVLRVPFAKLGPLADGMGPLRQGGFSLVALTARGGTDIGDLERARLGGRVAVLVGSEGRGLSVGALAGADLEVSIPMASGVDSLNVATAAAIALHHLARP